MWRYDIVVIERGKVTKTTGPTVEDGDEKISTKFFINLCFSLIFILGNFPFWGKNPKVFYPKTADKNIRWNTSCVSVSTTTKDYWLVDFCYYYYYHYCR
jgi:hypothetical protein